MEGWIRNDGLTERINPVSKDQGTVFCEMSIEFCFDSDASSKLSINLKCYSR